ncbi:hypothetical protein MRX96_051030 [Rhipicephalus microplus]
MCLTFLLGFNRVTETPSSPALLDHPFVQKSPHKRHEGADHLTSPGDVQQMGHEVQELAHDELRHPPLFDTVGHVFEDLLPRAQGGAV